MPKTGNAELDAAMYQEGGMFGFVKALGEVLEPDLIEDPDVASAVPLVLEVARVLWHGGIIRDVIERLREKHGLPSYPELTGTRQLTHWYGTLFSGIASGRYLVHSDLDVALLVLGYLATPRAMVLLGAVDRDPDLTAEAVRHIGEMVGLDAALVRREGPAGVTTAELAGEALALRVFDDRPGDTAADEGDVVGEDDGMSMSDSSNLRRLLRLVLSAGDAAVMRAMGLDIAVAEMDAATDDLKSRAEGVASSAEQGRAKLQRSLQKARDRIAALERDLAVARKTKPVVPAPDVSVLRQEIASLQAQLRTATSRAARAAEHVRVLESRNVDLTRLLGRSPGEPSAAALVTQQTPRAGAPSEPTPDDQPSATTRPASVAPDPLAGRAVYLFTNHERSAIRRAMRDRLLALGAASASVYEFGHKRIPGPIRFPADSVVLVDTSFAAHKDSTAVRARAARSGACYAERSFGVGGLEAVVRGLVGGQSVATGADQVGLL